MSCDSGGATTIGLIGAVASPAIGLGIKFQKVSVFSRKYHASPRTAGLSGGIRLSKNFKVGFVGA